MHVSLMGTNMPDIGTGLWHKPRVYGTLVSLCLFLLGGSTIIITTYLITIAGSEVFCPQCNASEENLLNATYLIEAGLVIFGLSVSAAMILAKDRDRGSARYVVWTAVIFWTFVSIFAYFALGSAISRPGFGASQLWSYFAVYLIWSTTGIMWILLRRRYSYKSNKSS
jgi:hypothetical protein